MCCYKKKEKFFVNNKISTWILLVCKKTTFLIIYDLHHSTNTQTEILYGVRLFFRLIIKQTYCSKNRFFYSLRTQLIFYDKAHAHTLTGILFCCAFYHKRNHFSLLYGWFSIQHLNAWVGKKTNRVLYRSQ